MTSTPIVLSDLDRLVRAVVPAAATGDSDPDRAVRLRPTQGGALAEACSAGFAARLLLPDLELPEAVSVEANALAAALDLCLQAEVEYVTLHLDEQVWLGVGGVAVDATPPPGTPTSLSDVVSTPDGAGALIVTIDRVDLLMLLDAARRMPSGLGDDASPTVLFTVEPDFIEFGTRWTGGRLVRARSSCRATGSAEGAVHPHRLFVAASAATGETIELEVGEWGGPMWMLRDGLYLAAFWPLPVGIEIYRSDFERMIEPYHDPSLDSELGPDDDGDYLLRHLPNSSLYARLDYGHDRWGSDAVAQVFAVVAAVPCSADLLAELNAINSSLRYGRILWVGGQVLVEADLYVDGLAADELDLIIGRVVDGAEHVGPLLRSFFAESGEGESS